MEEETASDNSASGPTERRLTFATAQMVGRELLLQLLLKHGLSESQADDALDDVARLLRSVDIPTDEASLEEISEVLGQALSRLADQDPGIRSAIDEASRVAEQDIEPKTLGTDAAWFAGSVAIGLSLLLFVAKLDGRYDFETGHGFIELSHGIPSGYKDAASVLGNTVSGTITKLSNPATSRGKQGGDAGSGGGMSSGGSKEPSEASEARLKSGRSGPNHLRHSVAHLDDAAEGHLPHEDAIRRRDEIFDAFHSGNLLNEFLEMPEGDLFWARSVGFSVPWTGKPAFTLGAGLVADSTPPTVGSAARGNYVGFRIAIRLQSPKPLKPDILRRISEVFGRLYPRNAVAVRWVGPIMCLASNPDGNFLPWRCKSTDLPEIGSPLNIAGGAAAAASLHLSEGDRNFLLTVGHALRDDGSGKVGTAVFSHPQPYANWDPRRRIGTVSRLANFPPFRLGPSKAASRPKGVPTLDYGLVRLDAGCVPRQDRRCLAGNNLFTREPYEFVPTDSSGSRVMVKAAARSGEARGILRSVSQSLEMHDPLTGRAVYADGLIEVSLENGASVRPGDSGSLICLADNGTLRPAAILVAGSKAAMFQAGRTAMETALYAMPLSSIPELETNPAPDIKRMSLG